MSKYFALTGDGKKDELTDKDVFAFPISEETKTSVSLITARLYNSSGEYVREYVKGEDLTENTKYVVFNRPVHSGTWQHSFTMRCNYPSSNSEVYVGYIEEMPDKKLDTAKIKKLDTRYFSRSVDTYTSNVTLETNGYIVIWFNYSGDFTTAGIDSYTIEQPKVTAEFVSPTGVSYSYDDTSVKADISALQTGKVDKADGMSLIEDTEKARLATVVNYDDTDIKADISKCATKDVATTTKNGLMSATDKKKLNGIDTSEGYKVFMQTSKPTEDGLWIKGTKKDFMFASYIPPSVDLLSVTLPSVRKYTSAVAINGKAYIFGGEYYRNSSEYGVFSDILEFDPVSGTCTKMSVSLPGKRTCTSAVVINGKAYIFGGNGTKDGNSSNSIFEFDPVAKTCTQMSVSLPVTRYEVSAVAINGKAYIFGGYSSTSIDDIVEGSFDWYGFDFAGYYIKPCNSPNGQLTKISSHEISSIEKVYNGQTGAVMEAYSVFNGVATKIE